MSFLGRRSRERLAREGVSEEGGAESAGPAEQSEFTRWLEILSAIIMSMAVVGSAYSAWQATRWGGVQAVAFTTAGGSRTQSVAEFGRANAEVAYDATIFGQLAIAFRDDPEAATNAGGLIDLLVRDEFRTAIDAWLALDPLNDPDAPTTPFDLPEYTNAHQEEGERLQEQANLLIQEGKEANQNGDDYIFAVVLFASVLFFAGIVPKFRSPRVQTLVLTLALAGLGGGIWRILSLPFH